MKKQKWRWIFIITITGLSLFLLLSVRTILTPFIMAFVLAYLLNPLVEALMRRGLGRKTAIAFVFIGIVLFLGLIIFIFIPKLYGELSKLTQVLPGTLQTLEVYIRGFRANFQASGLPSQVISVIDEHLSEGETFLVMKLEDFLHRLPAILTSLTLYILAPVIAVYLLADWERLQAGLLRIVPQRKRVAWQRVVQDISHIVRSFIRGDLMVSLIVGILTGIGVKLVGMDYALLIGVLCGVFDLIPYFGPIIGAVPSILLGFVISPVMALKVAIVIIVVQQLESNIISPKLMGDSVGLHPLWVIFALLAGGEIGGFWGMLFSVPFAAVLRVIIRHIYLWLVSPELK